MKRHLPTMKAELIFQDFGPNAPHNFCSTCELRIENSIHHITEEYLRLEELADKSCDGNWTEHHWKTANEEFLKYKIENGYEEYPKSEDEL
jgi:hypothetical protein